MAVKKTGKQTICFQNPPVITGYASIVGKKEGQGPLKETFDRINEDTTFGETTWEKAESRMQKDTLNLAVQKSGISLETLEFVFGGDLLNQCIGTSFSVKDSGVPFFGLYGACSTMAEGLILASSIIDGGFADHAAAVTSSHFCSAERQYRYPLEYGGQRPPTSQWTVTGAGSVVLSSSGKGPKITHATVGVVQDLGIKDANNMGAAMVPAAYDTISSF
ncbi:MAG: stage V sporulation protein AD, partial [Bacillota bacterium]|nr:stage V sporulation protein AD [Bacillota bacterium]